MMTIESQSPKRWSKENTWAEHFKRLLNRPPPTTCTTLPTAEEQLPANINPLTKSEALNAIKMLKAGKTAGPDAVRAETWKMRPETTTDLMTPSLEKVWKGGKVPEYWKKGY
ncbi:unnamed protein product [Trichobilharzia regenti]|nr:unnamed protein product [Trichobilharzia regenti]